MADWVGLGIGLAALPIAELIHRYYSIYMLQDFEAAFFMKVKEVLGLLGIATPADPHFDFRFSYTFSVAGSPSWWPPFWSWNGWSKPFNEPVSVTIPLHDLWDIPLPIGLLDPLGLIVAGVSADLHKKPDLRMLLFMSNVSADTFAENGIDPVGASTRFQNSFMMALTYRAFPDLFQGGGSDANRAAFASSMELLNSAGDLSGRPRPDLPLEPELPLDARPEPQQRVVGGGVHRDGLHGPAHARRGQPGRRRREPPRSHQRPDATQRRGGFHGTLSAPVPGALHR